MVVPILICIQALSISVEVESNGSASLPKESREVFARRPFTTLTCSASSLSDDALPEQHSRIFSAPTIATLPRDPRSAACRSAAALSARSEEARSRPAYFVCDTSLHTTPGSGCPNFNLPLGLIDVVGSSAIPPSCPLSLCLLWWIFFFCTFF